MSGRWGCQKPTFLMRYRLILLLLHHSTTLRRVQTWTDYGWTFNGWSTGHTQNTASNAAQWLGKTPLKTKLKSLTPEKNNIRMLSFHIKHFKFSKPSLLVSLKLNFGDQIALELMIHLVSLGRIRLPQKCNIQEGRQTWIGQD